jgi:hypothetical protein
MKRLLASAIGLALLLSCDRPMIDTYERCAVANLKTLTTAQADFRANDRDGDKAENFWVKDVAGLWGLQAGGEPLRLIDRHAAKADRTPGRGAYPGHADEPPSCGYFFGALKRYGQGGKAVDYDDGKGRNPARFGLIAWPEKVLRKGMPTYIVSERNEIYSKDTGGKPVEEFPEDPPAAGWKREN